MDASLISQMKVMEDENRRLKRMHTDPPGVVYFCALSRGGENAETFRTGFDGILQIDGYTGTTA